MARTKKVKVPNNPKTPEEVLLKFNHVYDQCTGVSVSDVAEEEVITVD
jgi:hypothetical protein